MKAHTTYTSDDGKFESDNMDAVKAYEDSLPNTLPWKKITKAWEDFTGGGVENREMHSVVDSNNRTVITTNSEEYAVAVTHMADVAYTTLILIDRAMELFKVARFPVPNGTDPNYYQQLAGWREEVADLRLRARL